METVTYISTKFPGSAKDLLVSKSKATKKYLLLIDDFPYWNEQIVNKNQKFVQSPEKLPDAMAVGLLFLTRYAKKMKNMLENYL